MTDLSKTRQNYNMNKHILLATDGSSFARKALKYLGQIFSPGALEVTVLAIAPAAPSHLRTPNPAIKELARQERLEKIEMENLTKAQNCVQEAIDILIRSGWPPEFLHSKVQIKRGDLAYTILREARQGRYDALVVGRRGLGRIASAWMGSVSQKLVTYGQGVPLWIVAGKDWSLRFLVPLDFSSDGLKVVDHLGFILSEHPRAEIVLMHVWPWSISSTQEGPLTDLEKIYPKKFPSEGLDFFTQVRKILVEFGISPEKVWLKLKSNVLGPAGAIIKEAREGGYGTVVIGRRGQGGFKELLLGSVSMKVLSNLNNRTVWVVG